MEATQSGRQRTSKMKKCTLLRKVLCCTQDSELHLTSYVADQMADFPGLQSDAFNFHCCLEIHEQYLIFPNLRCRMFDKGNTL